MTTQPRPLTFLVFAALLTAPTTLQAQSAEQLLAGAHILGSAANLVADAELEIHGGSGDLERGIRLHLRNESDGGSRVLAQVIRPAYLSSMKFLMYREPDGRQDRWVTTSRGVRRLTAGDGDERIFGSDFTAADLSSLDVAGHRLEVLDREDGLARIRATRAGEPTRVISVDTENGLITQLDYLGADGEPVRRYRVQEVGQTDGVRFPRVARLDDLTGGTYTVLRLTSVVVVDSIPDRVFSRAGL